ncbi:response regulator [Marinomonas sp. C2222]|uniref:Response regulator n=1 Tax=Marinomonas sargassi TaxID=2984494 RepID=A0ABT2YUE3_9GAMM|nr:hybrid sensor histidine kinase/response regulator [Marinomonas sargassi]MCV2403517.1 response regulator [Marinomonas sargassi]
MQQHQGKTIAAYQIPQDNEILSVSYKGAHLLLAEDNEINQQVAVGMLNYLGITLDLVKTGKDAIDAMKNTTSYDGILMDLHMPEMDGLEATRIIRQNPKWQNIPIIAMTASSTSSDKEQCNKAGMNDHIAKPIMPADLLSKVARWIKTEPSPEKPSLTPQPKTAPLPERRTLKKATYWKEVDAITGLKRLELNQELYYKLLLKFATDYENTPHTLNSLLKQPEDKVSSFVKASQLMHSIKGVAGNLGIVKIHHLAAELEMAYKAGIMVDLSELETKMEMVCSEIHHNLDELQEEKTAEKEELSVSTELLTDLTELKTLLEEYDSEAKQVLNRMLQTYGENTPLKSVSNALEEYQFDQAHQLVEDLEGVLKNL